MLVPQLHRTGTDAASSVSVLPSQCILRGERMPVYAMRLGSVTRSHPDASKDVDLLCDDPQMLYVDARGVAAKVVDHQPVRDRSVHQHPRNTMSGHLLPVEMERAVSEQLPRPDPFDASARHGAAKSRKPLCDRDRRRQLFVLPRPKVMLGAKAAARVRSIAIGDGTGTMRAHRANSSVTCGRPSQAVRPLQFTTKIVAPTEVPDASRL